MSTTPRFTYPQAPRDDSIVDELHGLRIADPYRCLEDPDSAVVKDWVAAENAVTSSYAASYADLRAKVRRRLEALQNYERVGTFRLRGEWAYVFRNGGLENQDVLYRVPAASLTESAQLFGAGGVAEPFLDLNKEYPDGTTSLGSFSLSENGKYCAYGLSKGGSDWQTLYVRDTTTGALLPETIPWTKFTSIAWLHDESGFFYCRHPEPAEVGAAAAAGTETAATNYAMVMFHAVGTPASADVLVYANPAQPVWRYGIEVSDDGALLLLSTHKGTDPVNRMYYFPLRGWDAWRASAPASSPLAPGQPPPSAATYAFVPFVRAIDNFDAAWDYVTNDGIGVVYLRTNLNAPRYRVVALSLDPRSSGASVDVASVDAGTGTDAPTPAVSVAIPESQTDVLDWVTPVGDRSLLCCYMHNVANALTLASLPPSAGTVPEAPLEMVDVPLPGPGTVSAVSSHRGQTDAFIKFVSFTQPGLLLRVRVKKDSSTDAPVRPLVTQLYATRVAGFDPSDFTVTQEMVPSADGTVRIPLFIVRRAAAAGGAAPAAPTLLYACECGVVWRRRLHFVAQSC